MWSALSQEEKVSGQKPQAVKRQKGLSPGHIPAPRLPTLPVALPSLLTVQRIQAQINLTAEQTEQKSGLPISEFPEELPLEGSENPKSTKSNLSSLEGRGHRQPHSGNTSFSPLDPHTGKKTTHSA